jgi:CBS domain-containing protein
MLTIKDILQSKSSAIWSVSPQDTTFKAMEIMTEQNIGALLVIDDEYVAGIFSERDFARNIVLKKLSADKVLVEELMTREIYCITPEKSVEECMGVMTTAHIRHMPVFENEKLIGVVTFADIVKALLLEHKIKIHDLEDYHSCCDAVSFDE